MSQNQNEPNEEFMYTGNSVPKVLRGIYIAFGAWAVYYLVANVIPDLMTWLK